MNTQTHVYIGPDTKYGLLHGTSCQLVGRKSGGKVIKLPNGKRFLVGGDQVKKAQDRLREDVSPKIRR